jgi:hypothetical protein
MFQQQLLIQHFVFHKYHMLLQEPKTDPTRFPMASTGLLRLSVCKRVIQ